MKHTKTTREQRPSGPKDSDDAGLEDLQRDELSGEKDTDSLEVSDTDDDEDEGVGDGTMGKSMDDPLR